MIIVIADDITGAAEMAGLAHSRGVTTSLLTQTTNPLPAADVVVVATDTRSMPEAAAALATREVCRHLRQAAQTGEVTLFRKVDSAVRGHVVAELSAICDVCGYDSVCYLPANPSKGRTIRHGEYFVDGTPIDQTAFAYDPEFPARIAHIATRLSLNADSAIRVCDAESQEDVRRTVAEAMQQGDTTLLAGAADLFVALLDYLSVGHAGAQSEPFGGLSTKGPALVVCGSTQSSDLTATPYVRQRQLSAVPMPLEVFEGRSSAQDWTSALLGALPTAKADWGGVILSIPHRQAPDSSEPREALALRLRQTMAQAVATIVSQRIPAELVIEGGATAFAIIDRLGWHGFSITHQVAPGVVRMQCLDAPSCITFKPGSYSWQGLFDIAR